MPAINIGMNPNQSPKYLCLACRKDCVLQGQAVRQPNMKSITIIVPDLDTSTAGIMKAAEPVVLAINLRIDYVAAVLLGVYMQVAQDYLKAQPGNTSISYREHTEVVAALKQIHEKYMSKYLEENLFNNENENPIS